MPRTITLLALLVGFSALPLAAQTATLVGVISDETGAVIPGARIQAVNVATNQSREALSDDTGQFTIPNLTPAVYNVVVEKEGFRKVQQTGVALQVDQSLRLEIALPVGSVTESVEVQASVPLLNTENASRGDVIISQEIVEMPLDGRDFNDLAFLVPGVQRRAQGGQGSAMNINGARADNTNFMVDGFNNQNPRGGSAQVRPPIDAMQEFKLQVSGYSAEYGRLAGGVMNLALKTGGNRFHGTLFEFLRNDAFDARNFYDVQKSKLRRNQFGGELDGPVLLPRLYNGKDKTFFVVSWESYRQSRGINRLGRVPTELERAGDFSQTRTAAGEPVYLKDPWTSGACSSSSQAACFPGNRIPASRFNPVSLKILNFYPAPNRPGQANNFQAYAVDIDRWDSLLGKVDHRITEKDSVSVRYMKRFNDNSNPFNGSDLPIFGNTTDNGQMMGGITYVRLFGPTLINEARFGLTRTHEASKSVNFERNYVEELGISGINLSKEAYGFPRITVNDFFTIGDNSEMPVRYVVNNYQWGDTLTWVKNTHTVKTGFEILRTQFFQPQLNNIRGTYNFLGRWTNEAFGDFLLGLLNNSSRRVGFTQNYLFSTYYGLFLQDDWKATRNLTLNLGLRYEINKPPVDKYGRLASYMPEYGQVILADDAGVPNLNELIAAAALEGRIALASDYGLPSSLVYTNWKNFGPRVGLAWRPFGGTRTVIRIGAGLFYGASMTNPIRSSLGVTFPFAINQTFNRQANQVDLLTLSNPFPESRLRLDGVTNANGIELRPHPQTLWNWNWTLEQELPSQIALEISYVGSKGTHLGRRYDINQPFRDPQLRLPGGGFPRPLAGFNTINYFGFNADSVYNAGILTLRKRLTRNAFFRINYTFSKSIDDSSQLSGNSDGGYPGVQDSRNLDLERGRSDWDSGHAFTMNYTYTLPFLSRNRWLGGWQLAGTGRAYTGQPFTVRVSNVQLDNGEANRPDRIAKGTVDHPTVERWYDVAAFPVVPIGSFRFGNSGRNILDGPGFLSLNFSLTKRFRLRSDREYVQFRWEVFNGTNHPNFDLPENMVNERDAATITGVGAPRSMQFGLKYVF